MLQLSLHWEVQIQQHRAKVSAGAGWDLSSCTAEGSGSLGTAPLCDTEVSREPSEPAGVTASSALSPGPPQGHHGHGSGGGTEPRVSSKVLGRGTEQ